MPMKKPMHPIISFPMAAKQKGEKVKGVRMEPSLISRINKAGGATGFKGRTTPLRVIWLQAMSRIQAADFYSVIADLQKRGAE